MSGCRERSSGSDDEVPTGAAFGPAHWMTVPYRSLILVAATLVVAGCGLDASSGVSVAGGGDAPTELGADGAIGDSGGVRPRTGTPNGLDDRDRSGSTVRSPVAADTRLPGSVAIVGDSLTLSAEDELEAALSAMGVMVMAIDGVESRRMAKGGSDLPPGTDAIDEIVDGGAVPDLWIIALGTNDVGAQVSVDDFRDDVASVLRRIPAGAPVIWVDIWIRDRADAAVEANEAIRSVLAVRPNSFVVDWHAWGYVPDTITGDGVHLTDLGQQRFAATIVSAVSRPDG